MLGPAPTGVERALTLDNRFIKQDTLYKRLDFPDGSYSQDFALQWVMDTGTPSFEADVMPVEVIRVRACGCAGVGMRARAYAAAGAPPHSNS